MEAKETKAAVANGVVWLFVPGGDGVRVAAYLRVSTDGQSTEHQRESLKAWVEAQGVEWSAVEVYADEGVSGARSERERPSFSRLMVAVRSGKLDRVVLFESSRASRAFLDYLAFLNDCSTHGVTVDVVGKGVVAFESAHDMLMASVHAFLAQAEREKISERTKSGLANARRKGVKLGAPKGNDYTRGRRKEYAPELVVEVVHLTAAGHSQRYIATLLGTRFTARPLSPGTVLNIQRRSGIEPANGAALGRKQA
jgi:DNA invertase Pin-like site-specific DNA recombinase